MAPISADNRLRKRFPDTSIDLVFFAFKNILFSIAHLSILFRSCVIVCFKVVKSFHFEQESNVVSSAYISIVELIISRGMSFTKSRKRSGPKTEPWGTPCITGNCVDIVFPSLTNCLLSDK